MRHLLAIVRARLPIVIGVFVAVLALGVLISMVIPKKWTAYGQVLVRSPEMGTFPSALLPGFVSTQLDLIKSQSVASAAIDALQLEQHHELVDRIGLGSPKDPWRSWAIGSVLDRVKLLPARDSNVITVLFTAKDPQLAADVVNSLLTAYVNTAHELKVDPAKASGAYLQTQVEQLRTELEGAQRRLSEFRQRTGVITSSQSLDLENQRLQDLSTQLTAATLERNTAERRMEEAKSALARDSALALHDVQSSALVSSLRQDLIRLEGMRAEQSSRLGAGHPDTVRLDREIASKRTKLAGELKSIVDGLESQAQLATQRHADLARAVDAQRAKVLSATSSRDEAAILEAEVDNARRSFLALSAKAGEQQIEGRSVKADSTILTPASRPTMPSSPPPGLIIAVAAMLGLVLGLVAAAVAESMRPRIRDSRDLESEIDVPDLGELGSVFRRGVWPSNPVGAAATGGDKVTHTI